MIVLVLLVSAVPALSQSELQGAWLCEPYEIRKPDIAATVTTRDIYSAGGNFESSGTATYRFGPETVEIEASFRGRWELDGTMLSVMTDEVDVSKVEPSIFTPEVAESFLLESSSIADWYKYRVIEADSKLITERIDPPSWLPNPQFTCTRA